MCLVYNTFKYMMYANIDLSIMIVTASYLYLTYIIGK
jgi:hypothetical protein